MARIVARQTVSKCSKSSNVALYACKHAKFLTELIKFSSCISFTLFPIQIAGAPPPPHNCAADAPPFPPQKASRGSFCEFCTPGQNRLGCHLASLNTLTSLANLQRHKWLRKKNPDLAPYAHSCRPLLIAHEKIWLSAILVFELHARTEVNNFFSQASSPFRKLLCVIPEVAISSTIRQLGTSFV